VNYSRLRSGSGEGSSVSAGVVDRGITDVTGGCIVYRVYKYVVYIPFLLIWTLLNFIGVALIAPLNARVAGRLFGGAWGRGLLLAVPGRLRVSGIENLQSDASFVIVANHLSLIDIPILYGWLPLNLKWVMKKEVRTIPLIGFGSAMLGHIFLDRSDHEAAVRELQRLESTLGPGTSILFFPEGTRSRSGRLQAFKLGAFHLARDLKLPILPVTIVGSDGILHPDSMDLFPGSAELIIHPAISSEEVVSSSPEALRDRSREIVRSALPESPG